MPSRKCCQLQAETCKALAHPLRMEVIDVLKEGDLPFSDILERTGGLKSNLSQHLSIMVDARILKARKNSRCNYYKLSSSKVAKACSLMCAVLIENIVRQKEMLMNL